MDDRTALTPHVRTTVQDRDAPDTKSPQTTFETTTLTGTRQYDVSVHRAEGSLTAVVGPSGSGKSTLLKLIGRFFDVDAGAVLIGGRDIRAFGTAGVS